LYQIQGKANPGGQWITISWLGLLGDFDKPKGFRRYGTVFFMRIENISIEDNWCFPDVRLCKKHGRESGVSRILKQQRWENLY